MNISCCCAYVALFLARFSFINEWMTATVDAVYENWFLAVAVAGQCEFYSFYWVGFFLFLSFPHFYADSNAATQRKTQFHYTCTHYDAFVLSVSCSKLKAKALSILLINSCTKMDLLIQTVEFLHIYRIPFTKSNTENREQSHWHIVYWLNQLLSKIPPNKFNWKSH